MILSTKLEIPYVEKTIDKTMDIVNSINDSSAQVYVVSTPSGYGKTTVIANQLEEYSKQVIWYTLDSYDNKESVFLSYLIEGFKKFFCEMHMCNEEKLFSEFNSDGNVEDKVFTIVHMLNNTLRGQNCIYFVFDSFQVINNAQIHDIIKTLANYSPKRLKIIIITNSGIPEFATKYLIGEKAMIIDTKSFIWSVEVTTLYAKSNEIYLSEDGYRQLTSDFGGWAAGIRYACKWMKENGTVWKGEETCNKFLMDMRIREYLNREIFDHQHNDKLLKFLSQCAVLNEFSQSICEEIFADMEYGGLLDEARRRQLFIYHKEELNQAIENFEAEFIFPTCIKVFLREKCSLSEKKKIWEKAILYFERKGDVKNTLHYYILCDMSKQIIEFIGVYGNYLIKSEVWDVLHEAVKYFEERRMALPPVVAGIMGQYYYYAREYSSMEHSLNEADIMFGKENVYGTYRSLYKAILHWDEDKEKYKRQIYNAIFFLKENKVSMPFLREEDIQLIENLDDVDEERASDGEIRIEVFGGFHAFVKKDGYEISWRTRKGCELFAYLVELNGNPIDRNKLLSSLWNELPDNAVAMLHNMIYNIRKELSAYQLEDVIVYKDRKYHLDMSKIHSDVDKLSKIENAVNTKDYATIKSEEKFIMEIGEKGTYLENIDSKWADEKRAYYERIILESLSLLADYNKNSDKTNEAIKYYEAAMKIDAYSETIMEKLLKCYVNMGSFKKMKNRYESFKSLLKNDLGVEPNENIINLYKEHFKYA